MLLAPGATFADPSMFRVLTPQELAIEKEIASLRETMELLEQGSSSFEVKILEDAAPNCDEEECKAVALKLIQDTREAISEFIQNKDVDIEEACSEASNAIFAILHEKLKAAIIVKIDTGSASPVTLHNIQMNILRRIDAIREILEEIREAESKSKETIRVPGKTLSNWLKEAWNDIFGNAQAAKNEIPEG